MILFISLIFTAFVLSLIFALTVSMMMLIVPTVEDIKDTYKFECAFGKHKSPYGDLFRAYVIGFSTHYSNSLLKGKSRIIFNVSKDFLFGYVWTSKIKTCMYGPFKLIIVDKKAWKHIQENSPSA